VPPEYPPYSKDLLASFDEIRAIVSTDLEASAAREKTARALADPAKYKAVVEAEAVELRELQDLLELVNSNEKGVIRC
jgi:hypothetical protein